jgi:hypothetical protein
MRSAALPIPVLSLALAFGAAAPPALAQQSQLRAFAHDATRDGTTTEVRSGRYAGDDGDNADGDPLADRVRDTYETFPFEVPQGTQAGSLQVDLAWHDARLDFDVHLYRFDAAGTLLPASVAHGATRGSSTELARITPRERNELVEPGRYLVVVDNWCTSDLDPAPAGGPGRAGCAIGEEVAREDDFTGTVSLGPPNAGPSVALDGPDASRVGRTATFAALARDPDGRIVRHEFDLDGDGSFETDARGRATATTRPMAAGALAVGVRVTDDVGATAEARRPVTVLPLLSPLLSFSVNRATFGGRQERKLVIRFRLRERAWVTMWLYRGTKRIRRIHHAVDRRSRPYRIVVRPRRLRRGMYTVRLLVRGVSGQVLDERLTSRRR